MRVGRYEIIRPIAAGGMATVYLGRVQGAHGFERQVAIKMMHPHLASDEDYVTMFLDEARMASNLRHPNVVPTLDVAQDDNGLFLVMEYIEGVALRYVLRALKKKSEPMTLGVAIRIALDLLAGLEAAHDLTTTEGEHMQLVHRDVSPHNIMVGNSGVSRLMDFGIARAAIRDGSTQVGQVKGKMNYMALEQIEGETVDGRADLYSAGVVLWEMLTGRRLLKGENEVEMIRHAIDSKRDLPSKYRSDIPPQIDAVCRRALHTKAAGRYQTAANFAEQLEVAALEANIRIANARKVAELVKSIPRPKPPTDTNVARNISAALNGVPQPGRPSDGGTPSATDSLQFGYGGTPSFTGSGITATGAASLSGTRSVMATPSFARSRGLPIAAVIGVCVLMGGAIWILTSGQQPPPVETSAPAATVAAEPESESESEPESESESEAEPEPEPAVQASSQPSASVKVATPKPAPVRPRPKPASTTFNPLEP